mmetsp:Transcript_44766/g.37665  ORF Transcript_44766/g.37665 Transcript_44766/m.37665 type:complete len:137 (-) Transcript_44766:998-1408(-)
MCACTLIVHVHRVPIKEYKFSNPIPLCLSVFLSYFQPIQRAYYQTSPKMCVFNTTAAELLDDLMLLDVKPTALQGCRACMLHTNVLHIPSPLTMCSFCRHCSSSSSFLRQASVCRADGLDGTRAGTFACIHRARVP